MPLRVHESRQAGVSPASSEARRSAAALARESDHSRARRPAGRIVAAQRRWQELRPSGARAVKKPAIHDLTPTYDARVESLNFIIIFAAGYLVLRRPDREGLAFALLVASTALMAFLFLLGTRTSVLPPFNY